MVCRWLPTLYVAPDWNNYTAYEDKLYDYFKLLYLVNPIFFKKIIVRYRHKPFYNSREDVFYHLTCKNYLDGDERCPDPNRIVRIAWSKAFIENHICCETCCSDKPLYWTKVYRTGLRHKILFENFLVILEERQDYFLLVTGFFVEQEYYLRDLIKEAKN